MFASKDTLLTRPSGYQIQRSLRFRSSASAYLNRTPAGASNRKTWTWSGWVKVGTIGVNRGLFGAQTTAGADANRLLVWLNSSDKILVYEDISSTGNTYRLTTQVFRDPSAWYHIVLAFDTSNATAGDRVKLYVNGSQITTFDTNNAPTLNRDTFVNAALPHSLGADRAASLVAFDGYLAEVNFIDGQALTPSSFGAINAVTGVWSATRYNGTYGTNGFYLNFTDNSAATAATIGKDYSGNGNNWTPNNISVTAGVTYDSMLDVPLGAGGGERGNYAVLNPLDKSSNATVTDGNLKVRTSVTGANNFAKGTMVLPLDKIYFEAVAGDNTGGILLAEVGLVDITTQTYAGVKNGVQCSNGDLSKIVNGTYTSLGGGGVTSGTVIGLAYDLISGLMTIYRNGTAVASNQSIPTTYTAVMAHAYRDVANDVGWEMNFGQRPFSYTPPTGFKALHTGNLGAPVIALPAQYMAATLYTGNGTSQVINNAVNGVSFQPDFVWGKSRNNVQNHTLWNSVVGTTKYLFSNATTAETTNTETLQSFNSNGYTLGNAFTNEPAYTYVGWQWKGGGTAVSNTAGSITSSVSANVSAGFSVVTYTGNGTAGATIGHGLGVAPRMIIVKRRDAVAQWNVYHASIGATGRLYLNATDATNTSTAPWNDTTPTSTVFTVGTATDTNTSASTIVAYCFAPVAGYSAFGSYTGNGSTDGPFVFLGFRPRFMLLKNSTNAGNSWEIYDTSRSTYNAINTELKPDSSAAESTGGDVDFLSSGFKIRTTSSAFNTSSSTFIYMAFAESPFKNSLAR